MEDIVFIGDWIKDRVLGSGSFGIVVLWKNKRTDEKLAIKTCKWGDELTAKHRERWTKEVEMMQNFNNPNIVATKELPPEFVAGLAPANPSKLPILCMEYCGGGDLRQLLSKPECCAGLRETHARHILRDIGGALQFLHRHKITHRDIKPENIVLQLHDGAAPSSVPQSQSKITYKLIDLGYAKEIDSNSVCASFVGTLQYLAPELLYSKTYSNSVDYWSFGLLAFEVVCGVRPFLQFMAPVQWMPHVKKKQHEDICVYEPFHEKDEIQYSKEIYPETHISKAFKLLIENWLRVALEWDPKVRGRNTPSKVTFNIPTEQQAAPSNVIIFSLLESILSTKIIQVFSVTTLSRHSFVIDTTTTISTLKVWLQKETQVAVSDQVLISQSTYVDIEDTELVEKYWNEQANYMLFVFSKTTLVNETLEPIVPKAVQRCLAQPRQLYNYKNGQILYRHGLYFVMSQMDIYEGLVSGLFTRAESFKQESKQLLLKHNAIDKSVGRLVAQQEIILEMMETGKKHIDDLKETGTATNYLGGFKELFDKSDELSDKITKLQIAWDQLSTRLQSAARRSNEVLSTDLNSFMSKYNFQALYANAVNFYVTYKRNEFQSEHRTKEKQCTDITKICYDCLKMRSKIVAEMQDNQNNKIILKLKDLSVELAKISDIIANASNNVVKLDAEVRAVSKELAECVWRTLSMLAVATDHDAELPYSVVSFQKREFKIGEPVSKDCIKVGDMASMNSISNGERLCKQNSNNTSNPLYDDSKIKSLVLESLKIRHNQMHLVQKLNKQKDMLNSTTFDFSFLNEN